MLQLFVVLSSWFFFVKKEVQEFARRKMAVVLNQDGFTLIELLMVFIAISLGCVLIWFIGIVVSSLIKCSQG